MKLNLLCALGGASLAAAVVYTEVDDPRCHSEPTTPVIEPSPSPSPYPDPPTPTEDFLFPTSAPNTPSPTESPYVCEGVLSGFALIENETGEPVPGYELISGAVTINLMDMPGGLSLEALGEDLSGAKFRCEDCVWQSDHEHSEGKYPFAMNGDSGRNYLNPVVDLVTPGTYYVEAIGRTGSSFESWDDKCELWVTVVGGSTIDNDEYCAPEQIALSTVGNQVFESPPVIVQSIDVNNTVLFKTKNTINGQAMDWITTSFVSASGVEVCDKIENFAYAVESEHVYEAKCFDGFAYADIYAYSPNFSEEQASADTSFLPEQCKNDFDGKVIRYSFVFSCDCENIPDIPDTVTGNERKPPVCTGPDARIFGEPHIYPYDAVEFNCQGEGEHLLTHADIVGRDFDFKLHGRFTKYRWMDPDNTDMPWTWNDGIVAEQDVKVQLSVAEVPNSLSMEFSGMFVNFYVDGVQRNLNEGSGDHRVLVTLEERFITVYFTTTGIEMTVEVRPFSINGALQGVMGRNEASGMQIPGCFTVDICIPEVNDKIQNFVGLLGTPNGDVNDDYKDKNGNIVAMDNMDSKWYDRTPYCKANWCLTDSQESIFDYADGYGFDYYNYCDEPERRELFSLDSCELTPEEEQSCADAFTDADTINECKIETCISPVAGSGFIEDETKITEHEENLIYAPALDDFRGCSIDGVTTVKAENPDYIGEAKCKNEYDCDNCLGHPDAWYWLPHGDDSSRRRLNAGTPAEPKNLRPDIPAKRNVVPFSTLV